MLGNPDGSRSSVWGGQEEETTGVRTLTEGLDGGALILSTRIRLAGFNVVFVGRAFIV